MEEIKIKLSTKEKWIGAGFSSPAILGMLVFFLIPFVITIYYSFTNGISSGQFIGFENYMSVLSSQAFQLAAGNTLKFNAVAVPLIMVFSFIIAMILAKRLRGTGFFSSVFIFPLVLPTASVILFFQIIFSENGMANSLLQAMGLPISDWLNSDKAFIVLLCLYIWKNCGYNIILFLAAINSIPKTIYEAAEIDGAKSFSKMFKITLPLITPSLFFIFIISIINSFKVFREAYILCGEIPHKSIYMLQHFMNNNFANLNYQRLSVGAILVFAVIFLMIFVLMRFKNRYEDNVI